jgi:ABC-2 type transport system permease protein
VRAGVLFLLGPKFRSRLNRARRGEGARGGVGRFLVLGFVALVFWSMLFAGITRMLLYFRGTQGIGDLLAGKLLGLAFLTFGMILLLSNVVSALSTFFLSRDLDLLMAAPVDRAKLYGGRLTETVVNSSWMVALVAVPILAGYGVTYGGGPAFALLCVLVVIPFLVIPAVVGSAVTLFLVNVFPARRTRDLLALMGLFAVAGVVALVRFLRPERLMRPEEFRSLVDFVAVLRTPTSPWLPSEWVAEALLSQLVGRFDAFPLLLLWSTAAAAVVVGAWLHGRHHARGYTRAQEGAELRAGRARSAWAQRLVPWAPVGTRELVAKEVRVFFRDSTQWSQLLLLGVLVAVYVYNIRVLPLATGEQVSFFLVNLVSFLNLGLAGFVVAAIAARFVYPAVSLEGRMRWLTRSAPLDAATLFRVKFWVGTVPLLLVAVPLILATGFILNASPFVLLLTSVTMVAMTFALTAMALAFGAVYPNYETENAAEIPTSFGGLLFMMTAASYLTLVVALEAWPVYRFLSGRLAVGSGAGGALAEGARPAGSIPGGAVVMINPPGGTLPLLAGLTGVALLTAAAIGVSIRVGLRRMREAEA